MKVDGIPYFDMYRDLPFKCKAEKFPLASDS